jgi:hypothetical protein
LFCDDGSVYHKEEKIKIRDIEEFLLYSPIYKYDDKFKVKISTTEKDANQDQFSYLETLKPELCFRIFMATTPIPSKIDDRGVLSQYGRSKVKDYKRKRKQMFVYFILNCSLGWRKISRDISKRIVTMV